MPSTIHGNMKNDLKLGCQKRRKRTLEEELEELDEKCFCERAAKRVAQGDRDYRKSAH